MQPDTMIPPGLERIVLCGFMGSGKSTVGALLAKKLGWNFADLDSLVERSAGKSVPQIFSEDGDPVFRRLEALALQEAIATPQLVLALGGGAAEAPANRDLLQNAPGTAVIFLTASVPELHRRCTTQAADAASVARPLLQDLAQFQARYLRREPLYRSSAHMTVDTEGQSAASVVETLHVQLFPFG